MANAESGSKAGHILLAFNMDESGRPCLTVNERLLNGLQQSIKHQDRCLKIFETMHTTLSLLQFPPT